MAVTRREKASDSKYSKALGGRPALSGREPELEDVVEDLRDDVNDLCNLANLVEGYTFNYAAAAGRTPARLTILHTASNKRFIINGV